ncbi:hypothetical protein EUX98_g1358 [Antrodiella citrinella]|uniref:Uncharacterized protein n=1 Tax=Antrodiella citrinella TaxID=2447956 RepID=A0A4S4N454_9APHY|nr:hypothetical protein EUX98_g1358 [Antrodiella citrinella]
MPARISRGNPDGEVTTGVTIGEVSMDVRPGVAGCTSAIQALVTNATLISLFNQTTLPASTSTAAVDFNAAITGWKTPIAAVMTDATTVANLYSQFGSTLAIIQSGQRSGVRKTAWAFMNTVNRTILTSDQALATFQQTTENNVNNLQALLTQASVKAPILNNFRDYVVQVEKVRSKAKFLKDCLKSLAMDVSDAVMWAGRDDAGDAQLPRAIRQIQGTDSNRYTDSAAVLNSWTTLNWPSTAVLPPSYLI